MGGDRSIAHRWPRPGAAALQGVRMSTFDVATTASHISDASSARQGQLDSEVARALFGRRTATADASHVVPYLKPGTRVIDFGCGQGSLSLEFAALVWPGDVVGIDVAEASIVQARARAEELGIVNAVFHVEDMHNA